jgi:hypothetical protein
MMRAAEIWTRASSPLRSAVQAPALVHLELALVLDLAFIEVDAHAGCGRDGDLAVDWHDRGLVENQKDLVPLDEELDVGDLSRG